MLNKIWTIGICSLKQPTSPKEGLKLKSKFVIYNNTTEVVERFHWKMNCKIITKTILLRRSQQKHQK